MPCFVAVWLAVLSALHVGVCVCVSEAASGSQGASQPPGPSPLGAASSVEPARGLKAGPVPDSGLDPVLGRSISVAQATPAAGTPIRPQAFTCGSLEGQGLRGWMLHTGDPAESLHGPRLPAALVSWVPAGQGGPRRPLRMTPLPLRMKKWEPCWSRASQAGSAVMGRGVLCTRQGFKKPADSGAWVGPEDALQSPLRGPVSPLLGEAHWNH